MTAITSIQDCTTLNNGVEMPWLGFGVFQIPDGQPTYSAVRNALDVGYRSIDTATIYENEAGVGRAIADSGIPRQEIFVTTKVWNSDQGYSSTLKAIDASLRLLDMEYVDLYLVHWPVKGKFLQTWKAMEEICASGKARAVGVSNFLVHHLEEIIAAGSLAPAVNQVEYHPWLQLPDLYRYCREQGVQLEAWAPLMQAQGLDHPAIVEIARKHAVSPAQVLIRWDLEKQVVSIPKSVHPERIRANAAVFDFSLDEDDMACIAGLDLNQRVGPDPDNFDF